MNSDDAQSRGLTRRVHSALTGGSVARARVPALGVLALGMVVVAIVPFGQHLSHSSVARPIGLATACLIAAMAWRRAAVELPGLAWPAIALSTTLAIPLQLWTSASSGVFPILKPSVAFVLVLSGIALAYGSYQLATPLDVAVGTRLDLILGGAGLAAAITVITWLAGGLPADTTNGQVVQISFIAMQSLVIGVYLGVAAGVNWRPLAIWVAPIVGLALGLACVAAGTDVFAHHPDQQAALARLMAVLPGAGIAFASWSPSPPPPESIDERRAALAARAAPLLGLTATSVALFVFLTHTVSTTLLIPTVISSLLATVRISLAIRSAQSFREISELATTDELTGLANRRRLYESIDVLLSSHPADKHALLLLDLNSFKEVNDSLGHPVGDALLVGIGQRISEALPAKNVLSRLGGDEFAVLIPFTLDNEPIYLAQLIRNALRPPFAIQGVRLQIGCAIGSARYPDDGIDAVELLARADVAMYTAKRAGRTYQQYLPELETDTLNRLQLMADMETALSGGQFEVRYQPMMEIASGRITGAEALVRWRHPTRGLLAPGTFIELAEQTGTLGALTRLVTEDAMRTAAAWRANGYDMLLAINIGSRELLDDQLVDNLFFEIERNAVPPSSVVVEVAEGAFVDTDVSERIVRKLRASGVLVSIDDFGAGYSSLSRLRALDAMELKLDRSLTTSMTTDPGAEAVVNSSVHLAHALGMRLVAEGVEDAETYRRLQDVGCDIVQGFFIARPMAATELLAWLDRHSHVESDASAIAPA